MAWGRKKGAQPGNRNALKHGYYAGAMPAKQQAVLRKAAVIPPKELEHEIALLRSRIFELVKLAPENLIVLTMALRTLVRLVALHHGLNAQQEGELHDSLRDLIVSLAPAGGV